MCFIGIVIDDGDGLSFITRDATNRAIFSVFTTLLLIAENTLLANALISISFCVAFAALAFLELKGNLKQVVP